MGFPLRFVSMIMRCITSASYQILINNQPSRSFQPERGLRQGDPLSPYIFILCANVLSSAISSEVRKNKIHGLKVARGTPITSHLIFVKDNLPFACANQQEA